MKDAWKSDICIARNDYQSNSLFYEFDQVWVLHSIVYVEKFCIENKSANYEIPAI